MEVSRQRALQLKYRSEGKCIKCGNDAEPSNRKGQTTRKHCLKCSIKLNARQREQQRIANKATKRYANAKSYKLEAI